MNVDGRKEMSLFSASITSSSGLSTFTINSFTQNLASVLSDTRRSKNEIAAFFTRHWGEQFMPKQTVQPAPTIPSITLDHFRHYLATTARKHRQYIRARKALRRGAVKQQQLAIESPPVSRDEVADIFFSQPFQNRDKATFESVFLEPKLGESDKLLSNAERRIMLEPDRNSQPMGRHESVGSLTSMQGVQQSSQPIQACAGRIFRACQRLQQKLEFFDDAINALLNQQLESKNEQFWRTIHSYGLLEADLAETIARIKEIRQKMARSKAELCQRSKRILELHYSKFNRQRLLARLNEIACLRDAQTTVQMLLNQEDISSALECIHTAQEVLGSDLRRINCFRHLGSQLDEMTRMIGKMLLEEFEGRIQREFCWPIQEDSTDEQRDGDQLQPIVTSLIRCREFRFLAILREEIISTVKNTTKQVIKAQLLEYLHNSAATLGFNPSILSEHIVKLDQKQWALTLIAVLQSLRIFCNKIMTIQNLIIKCAELVIQQQKTAPSQRSIRSPSICSDRSITAIRQNGRCPSAISEPQRGDKVEFEISSRHAKSECDWALANEEGREGEDGERQQPIPTIEERAALKIGHSKSPPSSGTLLSMPCHDIAQLRSAAAQLLAHAIHTCEERMAKLVQTRFKDTVLAECSPGAFNQTCQIVDEFIQKCQKMNSTELANGQRSPIQTIIQQTTSKFLAKFTESRRQQLSLAIDAELWKPISSVPANIQRLVDRYARDGMLTDEEEEEENGNIEGENRKMTREDVLLLNTEPFMVTGSAYLLLRQLGQYSDLLRLFPSAGMELVMDVVQCMKLFNSRTCQLILGAGARQMVGLKTITVKHLALASRSIQLVARFIPTVRQSFADRLPPERQHLLRHFDSTARDYADHVGEIKAKLLGMMDKELIGPLEEWKLEGNVPTPSFQQIVMQIGKFYSSYSAVMPPELSTEMLHLVHANFRLYFKQHCQSRGVSPHDSLTYGMAGQDFAYYMENMRAFPDCTSFPDESIADVLQPRK